MTDTHDFIARYSGVYEHSPWVAERVAPLVTAADNTDTVAALMAECVDNASTEMQLALIRAHPDLAGKAQLAGELTADSTSEQASAGLDQCSAREYERFQALNAAYREKFGFPFVMAVRGSHRVAVLEALETRLDNDYEFEFETALVEIHKIARLRLESMGAASVTGSIRKWVQLEQPRLGTRVTFATDEFFAAKERLIDPGEPVFVADKYDDHGKWMDGWESRRRRGPGHDYCVIRLGVPGIIHGFDIDTSHFTGNFPPHASIEACSSDLDVPEEGWVELLPRTELRGDSHHYLDVRDDRRWSHVRLHIYPDGGVARLRIFGEIRADFTDVDGFVDLAAVEHGGRAIACSDEHYGSMHNLTAPGRGVNMGDGWETARRRGPGNDWVIIALGRPGVIERAEIDTAHFKGNYPDRVSIEGAMFGSDEHAVRADDEWQTLLPESKVKMDQQHYFDETLQPIGAVSHVRVCIYPDGGVSRIRLFGQVHG